MTTLQQVVYERPPEGLARGRIPTQWWVILAVAGVIVVAAVAFLVSRVIAARRAARGADLPPTS